MTIHEIMICPARDDQFDAIWEIFQTVIRTGDAFAYSSATTREQVYDLWLRPGIHAFVAMVDGKVVGTYYVKPNQPGLGSHVANAGFMVSPGYRGLGLGKRLGLHALQEAKRLGFRAMQFNYVVSTNQPAVQLWKELGFMIIGTIPQGFHHATLGYVDVYIMHRDLSDHPGSSIS